MKKFLLVAVMLLSTNTWCMDSDVALTADQKKMLYQKGFRGDIKSNPFMAAVLLYLHAQIKRMNDVKKKKVVNPRQISLSLSQEQLDFLDN